MNVLLHSLLDGKVALAQELVELPSTNAINPGPWPEGFNGPRQHGKRSAVCDILNLVYRNARHMEIARITNSINVEQYGHHC
jgi:hypothetical protein